ncbi:VOC family protein [Luteimicrobium sp. NPDC057192]|uniref:VOC family protein n=1 Tax=Luteimicrobium sp. NPDC057192 TaxID=3346042 RepID=UPI003644BD3C
MIFVNLPVSDLGAATRFYTGLGFRLDQRFSDENAACVVVSDTICVMLLVPAFFSQFAPAPVGDPQRSTQVVNCLSAATREEVDDLVLRAVAAGGAEYRPAQEEGAMYGRSFTDVDGHAWEVLHMDLAA